MPVLFVRDRFLGGIAMRKFAKVLMCTAAITAMFGLASASEVSIKGWYDADSTVTDTATVDAWSGAWIEVVPEEGETVSSLTFEVNSANAASKWDNYELFIFNKAASGAAGYESGLTTQTDYTFTYSGDLLSAAWDEAEGKYAFNIQAGHDTLNVKVVPNGYTTSVKPWGDDTVAEAGNKADIDAWQGAWLEVVPSDGKEVVGLQFKVTSPNAASKWDNYELFIFNGAASGAAGYERGLTTQTEYTFTYSGDVLKAAWSEADGKYGFSVQSGQDDISIEFSVVYALDDDADTPAADDDNKDDADTPAADDNTGAADDNTGAADDNTGAADDNTGAADDKKDDNKETGDATSVAVLAVIALAAMGGVVAASKKRA